MLEAGRKRAAPHVKTYIRNGANEIDWALLTSANLSKQAWGEVTKAADEVRIASWGIGVLVWPALFGEGATMQATFGTDSPPKGEGGAVDDVVVVVGLRLPLQHYGPAEKP